MYADHETMNDYLTDLQARHPTAFGFGLLAALFLALHALGWACPWLAHELRAILVWWGHLARP